MEENNKVISGWSDVNGLKMYYEIYGQGKPIVLIHGGGSTIQTSFGKIIPHLAFSRQVIAVELQAHGRTSDRDAGETFEQDADDVATLLQNLQIPSVDILGFSNGGHTAMEIAMRQPILVNKLVLCSTFYKKNGRFPKFWEGFEGEVSFSKMPQPYKDAFLKVNNSPEALLNMFNKDVQRMKDFKGWSDAQLRSIQAATLVVCGDTDVNTPEHAVEMFRMIPNCQLAIVPGGHGKYLGELTTLDDGKWTQEYAVGLITEFLERE